MKPIVDRKKEREDDIWYRCLNLVKSKSECETKEEEENWDKSDRRFERHIQYVHNMIDKIIEKYTIVYKQLLLPFFDKKTYEYTTMEGEIIHEPMINGGYYKDTVKFQVVTERQYDPKFIDLFETYDRPERIKQCFYSQCEWDYTSQGMMPKHRPRITSLYSETCEFLQNELENSKLDTEYRRIINNIIQQLNDPNNFKEIQIKTPINRVKPEEPKDICFCRQMYSKSEYDSMVKRFKEHNYDGFDDEEIAEMLLDLYGYDWSKIAGKYYAKSDVETKLKEYYIFPENFTEQERNDLDIIIEGKNSSCASSCRNSPAPSPNKI
jgi:hypothetical protein